MPCVSHEESERWSLADRSAEREAERSSESSLSEVLQRELSSSRKYIKKVEGMLCSVLGTLEEEYLSEEGFVDFIKTASAEGKSDVDEWWEAHKEEDRIRLIKIVEGLSDQERQRLKNIL